MRKWAVCAVFIVSTSATSVSLPPPQVAIDVHPKDVTIQAGTLPAFEVTFTNITNKPIRVIDARPAGPRQRAHFAVIVEEAPGRLSVNHGEFTMPPQTSESAYVTVSPKATLSFHLIDFRSGIQNLPPGIYPVSISYSARRRGDLFRVAPFTEGSAPDSRHRAAQLSHCSRSRARSLSCWSYHSRVSLLSHEARR